jgi:deferrochelatase/peroxidase EfeB
MPPTEAFAAPTGCVAVREVSGEHRPAKDSLGFAEGISQPQVVRGASNPADLDERSVGDFLVGDGPADLQDLPGLPGWAKGGSFLVAVDYRVDREGFWMWANRVGAEYGVSGTRVAAAVVGRDPSGIALAIPPDPKVPVTAHIRRANPRHGGKSDLPRILRRSIPYQDNGQPGLMFLCYQASIDHQFEVILREWCFSALPGDPADSRDALLGRTQKQGRIDLGELTPDGGHTWVDAPDPWILSVGGAYAFAPSMETLARFATQEPLKA